MQPSAEPPKSNILLFCFVLQSSRNNSEIIQYITLAKHPSSPPVHHQNSVLRSSAASHMSCTRIYVFITNCCCRMPRFLSTNNHFAHSSIKHEYFDSSNCCLRLDFVSKLVRNAKRRREKY